jgi:hypothetical protein
LAEGKKSSTFDQASKSSVESFSSKFADDNGHLRKKQLICDPRLGALVGIEEYLVFIGILMNEKVPNVLPS